MGYKLLQTCIDCDMPGLTDGEWRTLLVICRHADDVTGGNCHPSTQTICKKSRLTERVVRKAIQSLEANGWIRTSQNPGAVRFFEVDVAKINACLPLVSAKEHPRAEVQGDAKEHPRAEVTDDPVQKCTPSPCKSAPLREHIREQEEISNDSRDLFDDSDQKANRGAAKTEKTHRNSLIQKENRGAPLMAPNPAAGASKNADNPLNQKENKGADTPVRTSSAKKTAFCTVEKPEDVPGQLWADFITHRKAKKAPVTETVIKRTRSEAAKCSMTLSQAIEMMVARGWQGFEARYVLDNRQSPAKPAQQLELSPQALARRRQAAANKVSPEDAAIADMWEDIFG